MMLTTSPRCFLCPAEPRALRHGQAGNSLASITLRPSLIRTRLMRVGHGTNRLWRHQTCSTLTLCRPRLSPAGHEGINPRYTKSFFSVVFITIAATCSLFEMSAILAMGFGAVGSVEMGRLPCCVTRSPVCRGRWHRVPSGLYSQPLPSCI